MEFFKSDQIVFLRDKVVHQSAGGFVFYEEPASHILYVALLQKSDGKFYIPKGHIQKNEKSELAALREIKEELMLDKNPKIITKIGKDSYVFTLPNDKRPHYKNVHLYVFNLPQKENIKPLEKEDFISAQWLEFDEALEKIAFDKKNLQKAKQCFYSHKSTTLEFNKIKYSITKILKDNLKNNIFAVVFAGSIASENYKKSWSDIDILIVINVLDLRAKQKIAQIVNILEKRHKQHFGINAITKQEFQNPVLPTISMEGKTLQALLDLKLSPERLIFCKNKYNKNIYSPNKKEIKNYSISNLAMFLLRNRRILTRQSPKTMKQYKSMVAKEIRASFIMVKLAIQYFTLHNCKSNKEIMRKSEDLFSDFDFNTLKNNLKIIDKWSQIKNSHQLDKILNSTDSFIEKFSHYVFEKASK